MAKITMYSKSLCPFCQRAKELLRSRDQTWQEIDVEQQPRALQEMIERSGRQTVPQIWIGDIHVGGFEELAALEKEGRLDELLGSERTEAAETEHVRLLIIGSGPAGYTTAIYAARAELEPVVVAGAAFGGQLMLTTDIENYPGFPEGITGPDIMDLFRKQAERFGARVYLEDAIEVDLGVHPFRIRTDERELSAEAVVIATGASARWLGLESEKRLMNLGVSACATCDGALFRGKEIAVVGGGDTAMEEALFLTRFGSTVHVIHRRDQLRASKIMADRVRRHEKIRLIWDSVVEEILGEDTVTGVQLRNVKTGETTELPVEAVFIAIGHVPNSELFKPWIKTNEAGYIVVEGESTRTNLEGVFACGDVMDPHYRQAVTAAGNGCRAALDAERWLASRE
jgi:thioredoxin reductase (NADPH)